jgi:glyoxylase-like metal-dependent hydrolase (beta-lactamase superfamily II)
MLTTVLPGLRELRAPLAAGYLWLTACWLIFGDMIPRRSDLHGGPIERVYRLAPTISDVGRAVAVSVAAYVVGSILIDMQTSQQRRRPTLTTPDAAEVLVPLIYASADARAWGEKAAPGGSDDSGRLARATLEQAQDWIVHNRDVLKTRLLDLSPALHSEVDRPDAEAAFRMALWPPLSVIALYLTITTSVVWVLALAIPWALALQAHAQMERSDGALVTAIVARSELLEALLSGAFAPGAEALLSSDDSVQPGYEIETGLHSIGLLQNGFVRGGYPRAYLIEDGDHLILVDTLLDNDASLIREYLAGIGRSPRELTEIVITHAHGAQIGGLAVLARLSTARVCCHPDEAPIIRGSERSRPARLRPLRPAVLVPFRVLSHLPHLRTRTSRVDRTLGDGDTVGTLEVLHVPGHTPGSLAFLWKKRALLVGDVITTWPSLAAGWPGFNVDDEQHRASLHRLIGLEPGILGPGHGPPIATGASERLAKLITEARE